jgi:hypothetical protein
VASALVAAALPAAAATVEAAGSEAFFQTFDAKLHEVPFRKVVMDGECR